MSQACREAVPAVTPAVLRGRLRARSPIVCAMSGGVDSSVAAALLVEQGHAVVGIMLRIWGQEGYGSNRCCTPQAVRDARKVAQALGFPFYLVNFEEPFRRLVVQGFIRDYSRGLTPNPCFACNREVRFGLLLELARALEADKLATGHYARVVRAGGRWRLLRGRDALKDQSYVLHTLSQEQLARAVFPLGELAKVEVRARARALGLPVAEKPDSQELCFVSGDYRRLLQAHAPHALRPGPIYGLRGELLGEHRGLPCYTVGQRRGLGLARGEPLYVIELDRRRNALIVGPAEALYRREVELSEPHFTSGRLPERPLEVEVMVRRQATAAPARLIPPNSHGWRLLFHQPQRALAPGQGAVFYRREEVLGGALIAPRAGPA